MNQLDLFLGAVVLLFALGGLFGGAVRRVIQIAALIIAFREAWRLAPWVESVLGGGDGQSIGGWGFIVPLIAFALIYIGIRLVGNWFSSLTKGTFLSVIDRIVGLVLGLLVGVYLMGYACLLFEGIFPMEQYNASSSTPPTTRQSSYLYPRLMQSVEDIRMLSPSSSEATTARPPTPRLPQKQPPQANDRHPRHHPSLLP